MSIDWRTMLVPCALAVYAAVPVAIGAAGHQFAMALGFDLIALILLIVSAYFSIYLAGSTTFFFMPVAAIGALIVNALAPTVEFLGVLGIMVSALLAVALGVVGYALIVRLTRSWRQSALAGASLIVGTIVLALVTGWHRDNLTAGGDAGALLLALAFLVFAFLIVWHLSKSAAYPAVALARYDPQWAIQLALPTVRLTYFVLLAAGGFAGLAAMPLSQGDLLAAPDTILAVWIAVAATVILAGRQGVADILFLALPIVVLPLVFAALLPDWPDLLPATTALALIAATFSHRGPQPGQAVGSERAP